MTDTVLDHVGEELHIKGVDRVSIDHRRWLGEIAASIAADEAVS